MTIQYIIMFHTVHWLNMRFLITMYMAHEAIIIIIIIIIVFFIHLCISLIQSLSEISVTYSTFYGNWYFMGDFLKI